MALNKYEQFVGAIKRSRSVAVLFGAPSGDSLASALAVALAVEKMGKPVEVISSGFVAEEKYSFLPQERIEPTMSDAQRLAITFNLAKTKFKNLSYEIKENRLRLTLTPEHGAFTPEDMVVQPESWKHDLIIVVDTPDLDSLGRVYTDHRNFFIETPLINIDHNPANEQFGQINFIDLQATATAEVVAGLLYGIDEKLIDSTVATCLLTGLISKTKSFRTPNVLPETLTLASRLVAAGGKRAEIVERLFRTRPVAALRLWGRVLARLKHDRECKIVSSMLASSDFMHAGAGEEQLDDVIEELIATSPEAEVVCIVHEHPNEPQTISCIVATERTRDALFLLSPWNPQGNHRFARITLTGTSVPEVTEKVLARIRAIIVSSR